jgi:hypothetical protein
VATDRKFENRLAMQRREDIGHDHQSAARRTCNCIDRVFDRRFILHGAANERQADLRGDDLHGGKKMA